MPDISNFLSSLPGDWFLWGLNIVLFVAVIWLVYKLRQESRQRQKWFDHSQRLEVLCSHYDIKYREQTSQLILLKRQVKQAGSEIVEQRELSETDPLSELLNRRGGEEKLFRLVDQCLGRKRINLLYLDLDKFKDVNDTYGHENGDEVIKQFASLIQNVLREQEFGFIYRFGGEEFIAVIPEAGDEEMYGIAERLRKAVEQFEFLLLDGKIIKKTTSIGIAHCEQAPSYDEAIRSIRSRRQGEYDESHPSYALVAKVAKETKELADSFMYEAKRAGRNQIKAKFPVLNGRFFSAGRPSQEG